jgi:hypothetical protein
MYELLMALLTFNPSTFNFYGVTLNNSVTYNGQNLPLTGYGMGGKRTGPTVTKIAVNQFFTERPQNFVRTEDDALNSLDRVGNVVMSVSFLRGVDTQAVKSSIAGVITSNINLKEMPLYQNDIEEVSDAIMSDGAIYAGQTINVIGNTVTGLLIYINASGKVTVLETSQGFVKKVFAAWFGQMTDQQGYNLKMALINSPSLNSTK